jgi:hypothetical protein
VKTHSGLPLSLALSITLACGSSPGPSSTPGGNDAALGAGGSSGGSGGGDGGSGGRSNVPDAAVAGSGGTVAVDAALIDAAAADSARAEAGATGEGMLGFYEAEAIAPGGPNELISPAVVNNCPNMSPNCGPAAMVRPETMCCFGGKEVRQLLRGKGGLVFNKVGAPADGMYDVTWYYHCGKNDNFGDGNCGGEPNHPAGGCRPHVLTVNGERLPKVYEFHCYPGPWGEIHVVTTPIPLKGGDNSIRVVATPGRDAADLDAIAVFPAGKGAPPVAFAH